MAWVLFGVSLAFALLVVNVYHPIRRGRLAVASFAFGWVAGELPVHLLVVEVAGVAALASVGGLGAWPGWIGLVVGVVTVAGLAGLAVTAHRATAVVEGALAAATGGAIGWGDVDAAPVWSKTWRLALAVPLRFRGVRRIRNIDYWGDGNARHRLDVLTARSPVPQGAPVLVYLHGGAWVIGDKREQGIPMLHELARRGWVCVSINYRLSPRATWPAHVVDCKRAIAWVREHIGEYGGDPSFLALSGGSAGGHLAALVALTPDRSEWQPGFEGADTSVDACVPFYGVYDMTAAPDGMGRLGPGFRSFLERVVMKVGMDDAPEVFAAASPDRLVHADAPPTFVVAGTNDTLVPVEVARNFARRLAETSRHPVAFAELPRAQHAFDVMVTIRSRATTLGAVRFLEWARARAGGPQPVPTESFHAAPDLA